MDSNATNVVRVGLKHVDTLQSVVVEHSDLHVVLRREKQMFEFELMKSKDTNIDTRAKYITK